LGRRRLRHVVAAEVAVDDLLVAGIAELDDEIVDALSASLGSGGASGRPADSAVSLT
jgi:hypothetical protein